MPLDWERHGLDWPHRDLSRFVRTRGARFHVQRGGAGRRVLMLHGAGGATHSFADLAALLMPDHEILALDLPGQGFSTGVAPRLGLPAMAADIGALIAAEDFEPDLVVGHSAGAAIALRMLLDGHAAPRSVVALAGALAPFRGLPGIVFPAMATMLALNPVAGHVLARMAGPAAVRSLIEGTGSRIPERQLQLYARLLAAPSHVAATLAMMARWDLGPLVRDLERVRVPVVLAVGLGDRAVPAEVAEGAARALRQATIRPFPGSGHLLHEEAPDAIAALIRETG